MRKLFILIFLLMIPIHYLNSQSDVQFEKEFFKIEQKIKNLEQKNNELEITLKQLNQEYNSKTPELTNRITLLENIYLHNIYSARLGAIILIFGLLIEIIGATLLAGDNLSAKIKPIYSLTIKADLGDLAMNDVTKDSVMKFHGYLGSIMLILGFIFQMIGTILVIGLSIYIKLFVIILSCLISILIIYYLTGQTPIQTRKEKAIIIWFNIKRLLLLPFLDKILFSSKNRCDYCLKKTNDGIITFLDEKNSEGFPYLHSPQSFHYCHPDCIKTIDDYEFYFNKSNDLSSALSKVELKKLTIKEYIESVYPALLEFFKNQRNDRNTKWNNFKGGPDYSEVEAEKMYKRVKKIKR